MEQNDFPGIQVAFMRLRPPLRRMGIPSLILTRKLTPLRPILPADPPISSPSSTPLTPLTRLSPGPTSPIPSLRSYLACCPHPESENP